MTNAAQDRRCDFDVARCVATALLLASPLAADSAVAQGADEIVLDAHYAHPPTDWCPHTRGYAVTVKMDGPDIIKGPSKEPVLVRERVGGTLRDAKDVGPKIHSWNQSEVDFTVIGRLSAEFRSCYTTFGDARVTGKWRIVRDDGSGADWGTIEDLPVPTSTFLPAFDSAPRPSTVHFVEFGDRKLFTARRPKLQNTHHFPFESDEE